jgi:hypothetical protein
MCRLRWPVIKCWCRATTRSLAARIGVLANVSDPKAPPQLQELEAAGRDLGVTVVVADAPTPDDVDGALQMLAYHRIDVMVVLQTSMPLELGTGSTRFALSVTSAGTKGDRASFLS